MLLPKMQPRKGRRKDASVAQSVERTAVNRVVNGSNPFGGSRGSARSQSKTSHELDKLISYEMEMVSPDAGCRALLSSPQERLKDGKRTYMGVSPSG